MATARLYHLWSVHTISGKARQWTAYPMAQADCLAVMARFTPYGWSRLEVRAVNP